MSKGTCPVVEDDEVCGRPIYGLGYCNKHWQRFKKHGDPLTVKNKIPGWISDTDDRMCTIVEGDVRCAEPLKARGMCGMHWARWDAYGDPTKTIRVKTEDAVKFIEEALRSETDDCIDWPYTVFGKGYGSYPTPEGPHTSIGAHRIACERAHGPAPIDKPFACHYVCGRPVCVNPRHLRWGSVQDNADDMVRDGNSTRGSKHGGAKLTEAQVAEMRKLRDDGWSLKMLADRYGISAKNVSQICCRRTWKHLP